MIREDEIPDFLKEVGYLKGWHLTTQIGLLYLLTIPPLIHFENLHRGL
jgi:hypothetical protein